MNEKRFKEHFTSGDDAFVIVAKDGTPRRLDGEPLTETDRAIAHDEDPIQPRSGASAERR